MCMHTVYDTTVPLLFTRRIEIRLGMVKCNMTPGAALVQPIYLLVLLFRTIILNTTVTVNPVLQAAARQYYCNIYCPVKKRGGRVGLSRAHETTRCNLYLLPTCFLCQ